MGRIQGGDRGEASDAARDTGKGAQWWLLGETTVMGGEDRTPQRVPPRRGQGEQTLDKQWDTHCVPGEHLL